ncbi:hypothetical protein KR059_003741 [Drosophila kikkawai]|nr:hypothetical protein KR059_003741 [Drosophila kikkawai]
MSPHLDKPIASIYDMMIERHRKLTSESTSRDISMAAQKVPRGKVEDEAMSKTKKQHILSTKAVREMPSSITLESESYRPPGTVTASHLTKKQTFMKVMPPANKEVINKLVKKMSMACGKARDENFVPVPSEKPTKSGIQRKGMATLGTSRNKQKSNKSNTDRRPLSPRKAERGPNMKKVERVPKLKSMVKVAPKLSKTSGLQEQSVRESTRSLKTAPLSNDRWRI